MVAKHFQCRLAKSHAATPCASALTASLSWSPCGAGSVLNNFSRAVLFPTGGSEPGSVFPHGGLRAAPSDGRGRSTSASFC
jgi:glutamine synthetase type III